MSTRKQRPSARVIRSTVHEENFNDSGSLAGLDDSRNQRIHEKDTLQSLNTRLAGYIERVRQLEKDKEQLMVTIKDIEVIEKKEKSNISDRYEHELARLRAALDAKTAELSRLQVERDAAVAAADEQKKRADRFERDLKLANDNERRATAAFEDANARMNKYAKENAYFEKTNKELEKEVSLLRDQNALLKKNLEDESVLRASLQSKLDSALEDHRFQTRNLKTQLEEETKKRQVEMTTVSRKLESEYEDRLAHLLEETRKKAASEFARNYDRLAGGYKQKLDDALNEARQASEREKEMRFRLRELETSTSDSGMQIAELEKKLAEMDKRLANEQYLRRNMMEQKDSLLADRDARIAELNDEIHRLMQECSELADAKVLLDTELRDYETLLNEEESRLNISARSPRVTSTTVTTRASETSTTGRGAKRRRVSDGAGDSIRYEHFRSKLESHQSGPIRIAEVSENGEFIRLENTTEEDVRVGSWVLTCKVGNREVQYKFHSKNVIPANSSITVYSASTNLKHSPPNYVMKAQNWPEGKTPEATLKNSEGDRVAWQELAQFTEGDSVDPNERCAIM